MIDAKVLVVGGGPGGYVAAIRAGQLGLDTVLVEAGRLGGTCLTRGCIPSKALIHAADRFHQMRQAASGNPLGIILREPPTIDITKTIAWKDGVVDRLSNGVATLLRKAGVQVLNGWAVFSDAKTCTVQTGAGEETIRAENVILATGSEPAFLPGISYGGPVISSTEALSLDHMPARLMVIGAGYIGLELGMAFAKFGSQVTVIEARDRVLPNWDEELTEPVRRALERAKVMVQLGANVEEIIPREAEAEIHLRTREGDLSSLPADKVLVTVGRRPCTRGWGLEFMAVDMDGPFVKVDHECRTSMRGVWAIGDLVGEPLLAHKASAQGEMVAEIIAGTRRRFDPAAIPFVCFTDPEIAGAGLSPADAEGQGIDAVVARFPFSASGRALSMEAGTDGGFVRVVARRDDHRVLGVQAVGAHVAELVGEFTLALEMGALLEDVAGTIHAHPTLTEAFHEAALRGLGRAIHI